MVYVILRNGKVLQYNSPTSIKTGEKVIDLMSNNDKYLIAKFPIEIIERIEWDKPCRIMREKSVSKIKKFY